MCQTVPQRSDLSCGIFINGCDDGLFVPIQSTSNSNTKKSYEHIELKFKRNLTNWSNSEDKRMHLNKDKVLHSDGKF